LPTGKEERKEDHDTGASSRTRTKTLYSKKGHDVTLEDFKLIKVLGRGAFGKVMLVEKKDSKEVYALKSLKKEEIILQEQLENTKTEKMILEKISHPFLVGLEYCFQTPEKIFFVMQFMKGGELFQHLRQVRKFDEGRVKFYAAQLALGLGHLHFFDIVYRDLKPENVLLDENGNAALTDFGMAKIVRKNETTQTFCGTPEYLAPEIIQMKGHNKDADWWSFGVLM
jgi:serum/glucocorticoid-regulated kinase 2